MKGEFQKIDNFVLYQTATGKVNIEVYFKEDTLWLTQKLICNLFEKSKSTISEHFKNIFAEKELNPNSVVRDFRTTAEDGKSYLSDFDRMIEYIGGLGS